MKTIIVATDFSPTALNAVNYAADMAKAIQADLVLLHVYEYLVPYGELPLTYDPEVLKKAAEKEIDLLNQQLNTSVAGKINIISTVKMGNFYPELMEVCDEVRPYAVIMGSQGTNAAQRFLFGGHTVHAMKHLVWPLLTVPVNAKFSAIKKICFACDLHEVADTIPIDEIKSLINDFNAELHILNTGKQESYDPDVVYQSSVLRRLLGTVHPTFHFIGQSNTDKDIIDFTEMHEIDLLIVLPKRHSLVEKLLHKSHTRNLVLHSPVPVLALHKE